MIMCHKRFDKTQESFSLEKYTHLSLQIFMWLNYGVKLYKA